MKEKLRLIFSYDNLKAFFYSLLTVGGIYIVYLIYLWVGADEI